MSANHNHGHQRRSKNIAVAFFLNFSFAIIELIGGVVTNSVAVLSNGIHDLGDSVGLGLSWYMEKVANRQRDHLFSFGYKRFSLLAALMMGIFLIMGSLLVLREAIPRFFNPEPIDATGMILIAGLGVFINGFAMMRVRFGKTAHEKVIALHLLEDVLSSAAVLIAGILALFVQIVILDTVLSILIALFVIWNSGKRLKTTLMIFLQSIPDDVDLQTIEAAIAEPPDVVSVHDTHIWSLDGEHHVLSTHVVVKAGLLPAQINLMKSDARKSLSKYGIYHATLEVEYESESCPLH